MRRSHRNSVRLIHRDLRTPKYKKRIVSSKKKYSRKDKSQSRDIGE